MTKRWTTRLDTDDLRTLEEIGRTHGGLSISQMLRLAITEYIASESERIRAARQPLYGQAVGRPLWMDAEDERA